ncbi:MAG: O-antigen ligase family protein [Prevotellaceae bacterium]|nr:O-antigen ligase family protein [Prevotellaceae bacterium]
MIQVSTLRATLQKSTTVKYAVVGAAALFAFSFLFTNKFSILALWALILAAVTTFAVHRKINIKAIYVFPVVFFTFRMVSLAFAPPDVTFKHVENCLPLLIMPALFSLFRLSQAQAKWFLQGVFYALLLAIGVAWLVFLQNIISSPETFWEVLRYPKSHSLLFLGRLLFWHSSFLSIAISAIIPVSFYLCINKYVKPLLMWVALMLSIVFIFLTGSRIGIVVSGFLLLLSLAYYYKQTSLPVKIGILLLLLLTALCAYFSPYTITSDPERANLYSLGMKVISEKPVCGSGVYSMHRYITSEEIAQKYDAHYGYTFNHFHNTFIDEAVQFGLVGGLLLVAFFACLAFMAIRKKDFLLMAFLAIYLPFAYVESIFMSVKGIMPFMFWFCFLVSTQKERRELKTKN